MVAGPFRHRLRVGFGDVDHAGIVYYPRFFQYFHVAFEELFFARLESGGGGGYRYVLDDLRVAFPAVHAEVDFRRPLRFGDVFEVVIAAERLGEKSVALRYTIEKVDPSPGEVSAEGRVTCAVIDMATFRAIPLPAELRPLFEALR